jgi:hypothetical protein
MEQACRASVILYIWNAQVGKLIKFEELHKAQQKRFLQNGLQSLK